MAAGLPDITSLDRDGLCDGLLVCDLRTADRGFHMELADQSVNDDLKVQLAHACNDGLTRFLIRIGLECRVLFRKLDQRHGHFFLTGLGLGLDGHPNDGIREGHALKQDLVVLGAERIARGGLLEAYDRNDVSRMAFLKLRARIRVHEQDAADAFALSLRGVIHIRAGFERSAVNADERQLPDKGIGHDLERERGKRRVVARLCDHFLRAVAVRSLCRGNVKRRGQEIHDRVEQRLHALVAVGCAAADRHHFARDGRAADGGDQLLRLEPLALKVAFHELVVVREDLVEQLCARLFRLLQHVRGDLLLANVRAVVIIIDFGLHGEQVDDAAEGRLAAAGQLDG